MFERIAASKETENRGDEIIRKTGVEIAALYCQAIQPETSRGREPAIQQTRSNRQACADRIFEEVIIVQQSRSPQKLQRDRLKSK